MEKNRLGTKDSMATVAVKDLTIAKRFYSGTLGLEVVSFEGQQRSCSPFGK
jgi:catechol 2,3-dioxygenase-like lactoylglutathione lyase family enzyme